MERRAFLDGLNDNRNTMNRRDNGFYCLKRILVCPVDLEIIIAEAGFN